MGLDRLMFASNQADPIACSGIKWNLKSICYSKTRLNVNFTFSITK